MLVYFYNIIILARGTAAESETLRMANQGREVVRVYCVYYIEEELSIRPICRGLLLREELAQIRYGHHILDQPVDTQLVVVWHIYRSELVPGDELLLPCEHLLQKVFVHFPNRGHVVLTYIN